MNWDIGTTVGTSKGNAKVIGIANNEASLQLPDGTTFTMSYMPQEKREPSSRTKRIYRSQAAKVPKLPKAKLTPEEKELRKQEKILAKAQAKLAKLAAIKD